MDFKQAIAELIANNLPENTISAAEIAGAMEVPPDTAMGDFAFPCFRLSKAMRKSPVMIADGLKSAISAPFIGRIDSVKGYLNFYIDRATYAREIVNAVLSQGENYGSDNSGAGKTALVEYSSINIAKRFHIGHLSTTMIGESLYRLHKFMGYNTVSINHLGDWGTQFGKMIAAYKLWGDRETVEKGGVDEMVKLYVRFNAESKDNEELSNLGRKWFKAIEDGDPEALEIFRWFKDVTLKDAERVYDMLGVKFDSYAGESFYIDKIPALLDEMNAKGILKEDQGAQIVDLSYYGMPPFIIIKSDGTTIYATRDMAAIKYRHDTYNFDKLMYVVAYQQDLHFRQLFKTCELMGWDWAKGAEHVNFGMVSFEGQTLSTREGRVVYLEDLLNTSIEKAKRIIDEKSPDLEDKDAAARTVGVGAVVFFALYNNRIKDIDFWWDRALNFEGETGPYVMYTHARCASVLRKAGNIDAAPDFSALSDPEAQDVIRIMEQFPQVVKNAVDKSEPSMVTRYSAELAKAYNKFYFEHKILGEETEITAARVALTKAAKSVLKKALYLISIDAPEKM